MAKKMNARQLREQQAQLRNAKFAEKAQIELEKKKAEEARAAEEAERRRKDEIRKEKISKGEEIKEKSMAKAVGVKSVFATDGTVYMTSFGRGNDAVLEKKIISDKYENINTGDPAFELKSVDTIRYSLANGRIRSIIATAENPLHNSKGKPDAVHSDMLGLKEALEKRYYGKAFGDDNIHIQIIYNILDIEKILAEYSTNAVYALNNIFNEKVNEDIFERMMTENTYDLISDPPEDTNKGKRLKLKAFMDEFVNDPRLPYFGLAFYNYKSKRRSKKEIYDILALLGKLRHWCVHGNESRNNDGRWLYRLEKLPSEFRDILDKLYDETIEKVNCDFVNNNKVNIQILESIYKDEEYSDIVKEYYRFIVTKEYKNIGFSIKKLRETMLKDSFFTDEKYDSVRSKMYKLIDFVIWHGYLYEDKGRAGKIVEKLRYSLDTVDKEIVYRDEADRLWNKHRELIENVIAPSVDGFNIKNLSDIPLDDVNIGKGLISGSHDVSYFTKLMYMLTLFIDGKEINDLLTTLINKFDNIRSLDETMEKLGMETTFADGYEFFADSKKIFRELTVVNSFAKMWSVNMDAKRIMYVDALAILGIEMDDRELDRILCIDANGNYIKKEDRSKGLSGMRNFIASNVIESKRFKYLIRYGNPKRIREAANCEPAVKFVLKKSITETQVNRYYDSCRDSNDAPAKNPEEKIEYLAKLIGNMSFKIIEGAEKFQEAKTGKDAETKRRNQAIIRLYLTVMYLMLKHLVKANARYAIGFYCLERDAVLYGIKNSNPCKLTMELMELPRNEAGEIPEDHNCDAVDIANLKNRHLRNRRWYKLITDDLRHSDKEVITCFRNTVAHLNAIRNIDENIKDIAYVTDYFGLYHYIIQRHLRNNCGNNPNKPIKPITQKYFDNLDRYHTYCTDFVKAYCVPMAYNLPRFKNLTISGKFDKNDPGEKEEKNN